VSKILVDTSIWRAHIVKVNEPLMEALEDERVLTHPMVIGEVLIGGVSAHAIRRIRRLELAEVIANEEVNDFIVDFGLKEWNVGYVDAHLLATAQRMGVQLVTSDLDMANLAVGMGLFCAELLI